MMMEDYAKTSKNLRRHLTARSQERCLNKLRSEDIEKLQQFCKLHISFLTDMGSSSSFDELFGDKQQQLPKGKFSNFLARKKSTESMLDDHCESPDRESPTNPYTEAAVIQLIHSLQKSKKLSQEGIFRKSGNICRQKELKQKLLLSDSATFEIDSIHDYASVLKSVLSELPEPLLHERFINAHLFSLKITKPETRLKVVSLLIQMLSLTHYNIAKSLFALLHQVSLLSTQNRMNADNLGSIFAPHVLCSKKAKAPELQAMASSAQAVVSFIIKNATQVFKPPELLVMDAANYIRKSRASLNTSADSILSFESAHSSDSKSTRKQKISSTDEFEDDPMDTIITFADRGKSQNNTELELAKLYSYVQALPDNERHKQIFMKRVKEDKSSQSPIEEKRRSRTRSFGQSIKRHLSKRRRRSQSATRDPPSISSPIINSTITCTPQVENVRTDGITICSLHNSPYALHRSSLKNLQGKDENAEVIVNTVAVKRLNQGLDEQDSPAHTASPVYTASPASPLEGSGDLDPIAPVIRKPLLPSNLVRGEEKHRLMKKTKDYQATPPRPIKKISLVDSNLMF
ncbi:rho GTPase-activating protein 19-like isoform X2 [Watersipora subatra]|uniref:rho GTPase-activating protein 19-like isoform X2 n=1 Tax=Watersipora subatra TaxID=2589382 RepID=UPI00355BD867